MCDNTTHSHTHANGETHEHTHDHSHEHSHQCHCHDGQQAHSAEESLALLNYMIEHNRHHGEDLHEIFHALEKAGHKEEAELVHQAMHLFEDGNEKLAQAHKLLGGK